jgi:ankyrin repeat protein
MDSTSLTSKHIEYILNDFTKLNSLEKLKESDIDNIIDLNAKILLLTYYNYFDKLKSYKLDELHNAKSKLGNNIYLLAAWSGQIEIINLLEENGFDINIKNNNGSNIYLYAAYGGQLEVMRILEEKGFDIHIKNNNNANAYLIAACGGQIEIMRVLEEKRFDINIKTKNGNWKLDSF